MAMAVGLVYFAYTTIRDAQPEAARTLPPQYQAPAMQDRPGATPLAQTVLTLADLPAGWSAQVHDLATDDICAGRIPSSVIVPLDAATAGFSQGPSGPFISNAVSRFADDATARRYLDLVEETVASCRDYQVDGSTVRLAPLSFPRFGDDTFVAQVTVESPTAPITGHVVHLRVGNRVASIETVAFGGGTVDKELVEILARAVARRL